MNSSREMPPRQSVPAPQPTWAQRLREVVASPNAIRTASVAVFFVVWEYYGRRMDPIFMAPPSAIFQAALELIRTGALEKALIQTLWPFSVGMALTVVVGRKDRGIEKLEDLRGKKISVLAFQDTTYYALLGALASKGITKNDVNAQAVGPAAVASLVVAGTVDACACTPDWEIDVKEGVKDTVSLPTTDYFQSMAQAILASDKTIAERPEMVRGIVKATLRGMQFVMNDPQKAALVYVEASPSFKGKEELMKKILANYTERTYKGQATLGAMDPQRLSNLQKFYKQQGFIEAELPVDQLYSNDFIK